MAMDGREAPMFRVKLFVATVLSLAAVQYVFGLAAKEFAGPMIDEAKGNVEALGALADGKPAAFSEGGLVRGVDPSGLNRYYQGADSYDAYENYNDAAPPGPVEWDSVP